MPPMAMQLLRRKRKRRKNENSFEIGFPTLGNSLCFVYFFRYKFPSILGRRNLDFSPKISSSNWLSFRRDNEIRSRRFARRRFVISGSIDGAPIQLNGLMLVQSFLFLSSVSYFIVMSVTGQRWTRSHRTTFI